MEGENLTRLERGRWGERLACAHFLAQGHAILERNFRHRRCEVDLIVKCRSETVFVEVKVRSTDVWQDPVHLVSTDQQKRILRAAHAFLKTRRNSQGSSRFDIIYITFSGSDWRLEHIENAFWPWYA
jgi:putative endonuclease